MRPQRTIESIYACETKQSLFPNPLASSLPRYLEGLLERATPRRLCGHVWRHVSAYRASFEENIRGEQQDEHPIERAKQTQNRIVNAFGTPTPNAHDHGERK